MKKGWIIILLLVLAGSIGAYVWYRNLKNEAELEGGSYDGTLKPRVELSRFDFRDISDEAITMNMYLLIDNPLPVEFKARRVNYSFLINDREVVKDSYDKTIILKSKDSTTISLPAKLQAEKMTAILKGLEEQGKDSTNYRLRTTFDLDLPIVGTRTFTVDQTRRLPTYYIPQIKVEDIDYGKLNLKEMDVAIKVNIINKNIFPYNITDTHYAVTLNGKQIAEGAQEEPILVKKQSTTPVVFPIKVKPGQAIGLLPKALFDKKNTPFEITFQCKVLDKNNDPMFQKSQFITTVRGTLADFKKMK